MRLIIAVLVLLIPCSITAQEGEIPVSVSQTGHDPIGPLFASAFKREISRSARYELMPIDRINNGVRFYVELITVDVADRAQEQGKRSVISVVIQEMGRPNSFPVPAMWYHKAIVVDRQAVHKIAKDLLEDMDGHWCSYITSSIGGCPKEKL